MSQPAECVGGRSPLHRRSLSLDASSGEISRIPIPASQSRTLGRTGSFKMRPEAPRPPTIAEWEENKTGGSVTPTRELTDAGRLKRHRSLQGLYSHRHSLTLDYRHDDDQDSVSSMASNASSSCEHGHFPRNGTTYSARRMRYIVHCSPGHAAPDGEYLTPTQRANRTIRRLRTMLAEAQSEILDKDNEILRLTKELVEIRLSKASPEGGGGASEEVDGGKPLPCDVIVSSTSAIALEDRGSSVSTNGAVSPQLGELALSLADSGHFDDLPCNHLGLERELERVRRMHDEMRERYQDKVESLLKKITETNDKYYDLKPQHDSSLLRVRELEKEVSDLKQCLQDQQELHRSMLSLHAQEKEKTTPPPPPPPVLKSTQGNQTDTVASPPIQIITSPRVKSVADESVPKILQELEITRKELEEIKDSNSSSETPALLGAQEAVTLWMLATRKRRYDALKDVKPPHDAEMTLQFLKSAIFYFLTDPVNAQGHLNAILSILRYSDAQKDSIMKTQAQAWKSSYY